MLMVMFILVNGYVIRLMVRVNTYIVMVLNTVDSGWKTNNKGKDRKVGQMVLNI